MKIRILIVLFFGVLISIGIFLRGQGTEQSIRGKELLKGKALVQERAYWEGKIDQTTVEEAYQEFKTVYQQADQRVQHQAAHIFGEALYKKKGVEGFTSCDDTYGFGCFHSFIGKAIAVNGIGVTKTFYEDCLEKYTLLGTGCQHGIGHGLMAYLGPKKLVESLQTCVGLQHFPLIGCTSGVFMEYNFPTLNAQSDEAPNVDVRPFDKKDIYNPCNTIPDIFKQSCYFELPKWWSVFVNKKYEDMIPWCEGLSNTSDKEACILGIGTAIVERNWYDTKNTVEVCSKMSTTRDVMLCRAGASWSFFANPTYRAQAAELCSNMSEEENAECKEKADLTKYPKWETQ